MKGILNLFNKTCWLYRTRKCRKAGYKVRAGKGFELINEKYIEFKGDFSAGDYLSLQTWPNRLETNIVPCVSIGKDVYLMRNCQISCANCIVIGDGCLFGDNAFITDNLHGTTNKDDLLQSPVVRMLFSKGPVHIGKNVWLGRNVCVMPGVKIGEGAVIGANAVVTKDIPAYSVAVGVPAVVVKSLLDGEV